jgi:hypothetical protein
LCCLSFFFWPLCCLSLFLQHNGQKKRDR